MIIELICPTIFVYSFLWESVYICSLLNRWVKSAFVEKLW